MVDQIRRLARQGAMILTQGGNDGFGRLLAELLGAALGSAIEQLAGVGLACAFRASRMDERRQPLQHILGHGSHLRIGAGGGFRRVPSNNAPERGSRALNSRLMPSRRQRQQSVHAPSGLPPAGLDSLGLSN